MNWVTSSVGVSLLCFLRSTVNAAIYSEILEQYMLCSADKIHANADFGFQLDLEPVHTAKGTKRWSSDYGVYLFD